MKRKVRVLIADDAKAVRDALKAYLLHDGRFEVVGEADNGEEVIEKVKLLDPHVVTMDIQMPRLTGLEAITAIMAQKPVPIVVVAALDRRDVDLSVKAMAAGALEVIAKPNTDAPTDFRTFARRVADAAALMAEVPVVTRRRLPSMQPLEGLTSGAADVVGLVASTGGPPALAMVLSALPKHFPAPVFIAQHIAPGFVTGLVRWFREQCALPVHAAHHGMRVAPGQVYVAPDASDFWLGTDGKLRSETNELGPSGDRLLCSLAEVYGPRACAVVLTGMGSDGAKGLLSIRNAGGVTFAQDQATCVVYGMPQAAVKLGAVQTSLALERVGPTLVEVVGLGQKHR